jgi:predicted transcriptional regulator
VKTEQISTAKHDEILDRRAKVWEMRVGGMTVREIATDLGVGVATIQRDLDAVREELDESTKFHAETDRAIAAARLDKVARKLIAGIEMVDVPDLPSVANALAKIEDRRAKLLGLDAATKTELTGADGGPLKVDARDSLLRKLSSLAACEDTESEASSDNSATDAG